MPLPIELQDIKEETTVVGDIESWCRRYVESGWALQEWQEIMLPRHAEQLDTLDFGTRRSRTA